MRPFFFTGDDLGESEDGAKPASADSSFVEDDEDPWVEDEEELKGKKKMKYKLARFII